jgi:hypothetical protein
MDRVGKVDSSASSQKKLVGHGLPSFKKIERQDWKEKISTTLGYRQTTIKARSNEVCNPDRTIGLLVWKMKEDSHFSFLDAERRARLSMPLFLASFGNDQDPIHIVKHQNCKHGEEKKYK